MKIRDRYIAKTLLTYTFIVLLVWLSVYSFFNFLTELDSVGNVDYTILEAVKYILLQIPDVTYRQASPIILLGCVLGIGHLATTGQLIIFRVCGISVLRITWLVLKNALIFIIFIITIGEFLAPMLINYAESERASALGQNSLSNNQEGFWIRDGNNFINVNTNVNGELFTGITIIEINSSNKIERVIKSENANFDENSLKMFNADIFSINEANKFENISLKERNLYDKTVAFDQVLIDSLEKEPRDLSTLTIIKQVKFLSDNQLRAEIFELELYKRLVSPLTLIAMILMAMLFIFGSPRDITLGRKIFFGAALGLSFELLSRVNAAIALSFEFNPLFSSIMPSIIIIFISMVFLIQKSMG